MFVIDIMNSERYDTVKSDSASEVTYSPTQILRNFRKLYVVPRKGRAWNVLLIDLFSSSTRLSSLFFCEHEPERKASVNSPWDILLRDRFSEPSLPPFSPKSAKKKNCVSWKGEGLRRRLFLMWSHILIQCNLAHRSQVQLLTFTVWMMQVYTVHVLSQSNAPTLYLHWSCLWLTPILPGAMLHNVTIAAVTYSTRVKRQLSFKELVM